MIIYEDESLVIPVGLGNNSTDDSKSLQEKNVTITENTTTQVTPDSNYIGLSRVSITTDIHTGVNNQEKSETVHANTSMTIYPDSGYTGLSRVNVTAKADLQDKFAKISQGGVTNITYDEGFDGLKSVEVFVDVPLGKIEFDSSTNAQRVVTDSSGYCDITVNPYTVKDIYVDSSTSPQVIRPTDTDAFNNIYINQLSLDPLNINPSKSMQVFQGAYDFVQVHPVTSSIDSNIVPKNIRKDVSILGVKGTLESAGDMEELVVDSSTSTQVYTPSQGYIGFSKVTVDPYTLDSKTIDSSTVRQIVTSDKDGLSSVTVVPYVLDSKTIDSSTVRQIVTSDKDGLSSVTVEPYTLESVTVDPGLEDKIVTPTRADALSSVKVNKVTSNIDSNIIPENIRKDTTILGVTGTLAAIGKTEELIVDSSTSTQVYTPEEGNVGFSKVTVNGYTNNYAAIFDDSIVGIDLTAENLRGLKHVAKQAFISLSSYAPNMKYNNITLPDTVESVSYYICYRSNYNTVSLYDTNIINWPGPFEEAATGYPQFTGSTISSIVFPRKMRSFLRRSAYVIDDCTIEVIDLNPCQNLYNIDFLVQNSTVKSIIIPASCGEIRYLASNCTQLTDIYCHATTPPRVSVLVYKIGTYGVLHVPSGSKERYKQSGWMSTSSEYSLAHYNWAVVEDL